ncbi:acyl-CoA dehydrogenase family protein [Phaeovibrio sulfidiphilus]|uniref:Acyl-CoA dehydrogenase family protein n=1 Tax=Phaeovibrio sulfidiphilus TaxID=1220600 RepID=A0A8J7CNR4_9PROT|nr:acyl-CoA dehydrogenase family protein [Phaeovibrio sulfidiphilus]MBE1236197.1 acyl-CoA dehydrogenase family protein [Phaeovibrio sulfidiphilus]
MALDLETRTALVDTVLRLVNETLIPAEDRVAREDAIPREIADIMREMGLFGLSIPEEYGGMGLSMEDECHVMMALGRASPVFRSLIGTNVGIGSQAILIDGTEEQKQRFLPGLASGEIVGSFALTEPGVGSDAASVRTTARREGDVYILNGTKRYITNAPTAGLFTVMARTDPTNPRAGGVSAFLVERNTPGLSIGKPERKMGQQGAHVADVIFEDCPVPAENIIGLQEGVGYRTAMKVLDRGRLAISASCTGFAERILDESAAYANERIQFGKPIGEFQLVQAMIADSYTDAYTARCMVLDTARARDAGEDISTRAAACKLFCSEMVGRVADRNVQIHGGAGYIADYAAERHYRDVRIYRLYEGTSEIQRVKIGRDVLGGAVR